ncbi:MAG: polymer-forming cytoskeletal protein [Synergistaceae bacterium]|nr:polymer-forming cytoskeletal protein [Candidatus Equadaptatus faecalis]
MSAKENFGKAAYELFGIGSGETAEQEKQGKKAGENIETAEMAAKQPVRTEKPVEAKAAQPAVHETGSNCTIKTTGDIEIIGSCDGDIIAGGRITLHGSHTGSISAQTIELLDCTINGDVSIEQKLIIGENAAINGSVYARELDCAGTVNGDAAVNGRVSLRSTADIRGNVRAVAMNMEEGAQIEGGFEIRRNLFSE